MKKIVVIASTSGSVLSKVLRLEEVKTSIYMVVSDRNCGAIQVAKSNGLKTAIFNSKTGRDFSDKLIEFFREDKIDAFLSFYTRLLSLDFLNTFPSKVYNFHPSILPAHPGNSGFCDTIKSESKFIGSTLHLVDEGIDTGKPLIQSVFPYNPNISIRENRHIIFVQQCKILIQFIIWLNQNRIQKNIVKDASYLFEEFSPNLEHNLAKYFSIDFNSVEINRNY